MRSKHRVQNDHYPVYDLSEPFLRVSSSAISRRRARCVDATPECADGLDVYVVVDGLEALVSLCLCLRIQEVGIT
jgi:hypothetical protein